MMLAALAAATRRQEVCALVDTTNAFDPASAAGMELARLLWVRCNTNSPPRHPSTLLRAGSGTNKKRQSNFIEQGSSAYREHENRVEQALRALDLLLQSGGFGMIAVDFTDVPFPLVRRIPLASWFRFQRVVENTPTLSDPSAATYSVAPLPVTAMPCGNASDFAFSVFGIESQQVA